MKALVLEAKKRIVTGRKVKNLRNEGMLPGTIYGEMIEPLSIQVSTDQFTHAYAQTGETGLINLTVDGVVHPVLTNNVQRDPVSGLPIHMEFHQVNLKEKIHAHVPIELVGESQAVKEKTGTLLQLLDEVEVEALPTDLPEHIDVDVSGLINVNDHMMARQLTMPAGVTLLTDPELFIVKIGELVAPEPEPAPVEEAPVEGAAEAAGEEKGTEENKEEPQKTVEEKS